jgi:hypothetical protein
MKAMMSRIIAWLRGERNTTTFPTAEQQEVIDVIERVERKVDARWQDRHRMLDLQADVMTRQEPDV